MTTERKNTLRNIMNAAWQFVKRNGMSMADALKAAWLNAKLVADMRKRIVKFVYSKVNGELREAYGTLDPARVAPTQGTGRKANDTLQVYYDVSKNAYRSFKKANLVNVFA